ncbi:MAG: pyrroloquinoline quinone biosynthesis protein PqqB [Candidatus Acidiferrales bacterium]|jgi:pyrroloquinoline quinone biosynthesis protein B
MQVKILGSAAGGGFPQWNCACSNCARLRAGKFHGHARSQAQIAVRAEGRPWCLIGASPDLRTQILSDPQLQPEKSPRDSPIAAVVLTSADIDQVIGLLHLREFQPLQIYAASTIQQILREENSIFRALHQTEKQAQWETIVPDARHELKSPDGDSLHLTILPVSIGGSIPAYARKSDGANAKPDEAVLGLFIEANERRVFCASSLPRIDERWLAEWDRCDAILIDGTFWTDDELVRTRKEGKTAREMGHVPISGRGGPLEALAKLKRTRKIFYHVNNTNPLLDEDSDEYRQVIAAGWEIACDGMEIEL